MIGLEQDDAAKAEMHKAWASQSKQQETATYSMPVIHSRWLG